MACLHNRGFLNRHRNVYYRSARESVHSGLARFTAKAQDMVARNDILGKLRRLKGELALRYNVKSIGLFGSVARGEQSPGSDIDVLVEVEPAIGLLKFLELEEFLSEHLGGKVDLVSRKALKPQIGRVILSELVTA
jgi:predicted nucleotidyltransferase